MSIRLRLALQFGALLVVTLVLLLAAIYFSPGNRGAGIHPEPV
ncbi:MAG: hypothetical protein WKG07_48730 [Hymenobacter sp.]